jgi:hypothetical protein
MNKVPQYMYIIEYGKNERMVLSSRPTLDTISILVFGHGYELKDQILYNKDFSLKKLLDAYHNKLRDFKIYKFEVDMFQDTKVGLENWAQELKELEELYGV